MNKVLRTENQPVDGEGEGITEAVMSADDLGRQQETLLAIVKILAGSGAFEEKMDRVVDLLARLVDAAWATLRLPLPSGENLNLAAAAGPHVRVLQDYKSTLDVTSLSFQAFNTKDVLVVNDYPSYPRALAENISLGTQSVVSLPVMAADRVFGVVTVASRELNHFDPSRVRLLEAIVNQIGSLMENVRLSEELRANNEQITAVDEVARIITSTLDINEVYERFAAEVKKLVDFDRINIVLIDHVLGRATLKYQLGHTVAKRDVGLTMPLEGTPMGVVAAGQSLIRADLSESPAFLLDQDLVHAGLRSSARVPLIAKARVIGILSLHSIHVSTYGAREQSILENLANQIAPAVENAQLYEQSMTAEKDAQERSEELSLLVNIASILSEPGDLLDRATRVMERLAQIGNAEWATLRLPDQDGNLALLVAAGSGIHTSSPIPVLSDRNHLAYTAFQESRPLVANEDLGSLNRWALPTVPNLGMGSLAFLPIKSGDRTLGLINFVSRQIDHFTPQLVQLLTAVAEGLGVLLENARLSQELQASTEEMAAVDEVARIITSTLDINEVYERFAVEVKKLVDFDRITIDIIEPNGEEFIAKYLYGEELAGRRKGDIAPLLGNLVQIVTETKETLVRGNIADSPNWPMDQAALMAGFPSLTMVPLITKGRAIGTLGLRSRHSNPHGSRETIILERLASQIAPAIENAALYEETRSAQDEQRLLAVENKVMAEIGRIISSSLDIDEVYARVTEEARKVIRFDRMSVSLVDHEYSETVQMYASGVDFPGRLRGDRTPLMGALAGEVALMRSSIIFEADSEEEILDRFPLLMPAFCSGLRSFISVPLVERDKVTGVFQIRSSESGVYGPRELAITERIAGQIAGALANARSYKESLLAQEAQRRLAQENLVVAEIGRLISSSLDITEVYDRVGEEVRKLIHFDRMILSLIDPERSVVSPLWISSTEVLGRLRGTMVPLAGSFAEMALQRRSPLVLEAENEQELCDRLPGLLPSFHAGMRSFLAVVLSHRDDVVAVLQLQSKELGIFSQEHLDLAQRIGNQIAGAIANAQLYEQTRQAEEAERQRSEELQGLLEVSNILNQQGGFESKVLQIMAELARTCDADSAVFRVATDDGLLRIGSAGEQPQDAILIPYEDNIPAHVYDRREILVANDYPRHPLSLGFHVGRGVKSVLAAPVVSQESVVGVVIISSLRPNHFTPERVNLLLGITNGLGSLLENARLEDVRKQTEERMNETARLASIGELAAGVAHEINNPLTSVLGFSQLLLGEDLPDQALGDIKRILSEAQRAAKIVQNLLSFARMRPNEARYMQVGPIIDRVVEMKAYDFRLHSIDTEIRLPDDLPDTMVDEYQLIQVMLNLLTNAEHAVQEAPGQSRITIQVVQEPDKLRISVADNGPGIPEENLGKIFEPFFTTKKVGVGTGLGLSTCYGIVRQHGGEMWAEHGELGGATFYVELPVVLASEIDEEAFESIPGSRTTTHLLVVDDEPSIRDLLRRALELDPYTVDLAESGEQAWDKICQRNYDCIIMDLKMPGMSGPELFHEIEGMGEGTAAKVIFITGDTVSSDSRAFVGSVNNPVLNKPFDVQILRSEIAKIVEVTV